MLTAKLHHFYIHTRSPDNLMYSILEIEPKNFKKRTIAFGLTEKNAKDITKLLQFQAETYKETPQIED